MIPADPLRNLGPATILRADARDLPLADNSVDLIVTSPPYFALRSYQDGCPDCDNTGKAKRPDSHGMKVCPDCGNVDYRKRCNRCGASTKWPPRAEQYTDDTCLTCQGTGKGHYAGQLGSEATPAEFVDALIECTREMVRVVKPSGSIWVNLGDKYDSGTSTGRVNPGTVKDGKGQGWYQGTPRWTSGRPKSLLGIPWRYALRCIDDLGLILRAHVVWSKPNGLPESVTDRVRRSHEDWFHFTLEPRYYSAVDEIREVTQDRRGQMTWAERKAAGEPPRLGEQGANFETVNGMSPNPLGKLPGSVWSIPTEPLRVPDHLGIDHFAAFPSEWPKRIIRGWSPAGVCTACGEGRRPIGTLPAKTPEQLGSALKAARETLGLSRADLAKRAECGANNVWDYEEGGHIPRGVAWDALADALSLGMTREEFTGAAEYEGGSDARGKWHENVPGIGRAHAKPRASKLVTVSGYACACDPDKAKETAQRQASDFYQRTGIPVHWKDYYDAETEMPATRPAVILDPFGGTGTVAMVARALGRHGIHTDLSADYNRLARWRITDLDQLAAVQGHERTKREPDGDDLLTLLDDGGAA